MLAVRPEIQKFFDRYDAASRDPEFTNILDFFRDTFLNLDPGSAAAVPREALLAALPARRQLFASIGVEGLDLVDVREQPLDERHTIVSTVWRARFTPDVADTSPLELSSDFLLRRENGAWQIAVYLNHSDLAAVFAARGNSPASPR